MKLQPHEVHAFLGKRGSGKSNRAKELAVELMRGKQRVVCFDYHDEYSVEGKPTKATALGPLRRRIGLRDLLGHPKILSEPSLSLAVVPSSQDFKAAGADFVALAKQVECYGDCAFFADELGAWGEHTRGQLDYLATQSRHFAEEGVALVWVAQRSMQIPKEARTQITRLNSGLQTDPDDLDVVRRITRSTEIATQVSRLGPGESINWRDTQKDD